MAKRGDKYEHPCGWTAEITVPLIGEDKTGHCVFSWGAFLSKDGEQIAHMKPSPLYPTPYSQCESVAAELAETWLRKLGFTPVGN